MGLHIGLIGSGMVGKVHLEALNNHPDISSVSLAENDPKQLAELQKSFPFRKVVSDYRELLSDNEISIVDICLPHDLHYPTVMAAFQAGKHVLLEKPISNTVVEADEMIAISEKAGKRLFVSLNERFMPVHQCVRDILRKELIGKVVLANLTIAGSELERMNMPGHWKGTFGRAGGGSLADSGTHAIDLALDWFGLPQTVLCSTGRFVVRPVNKADDTSSLIMRYPDKIVNIQITYAAAGQPWSETRNIWGENGSIHVQVDSQNPMQVWVSGNLLPYSIDHHPNSWWQDSVKLAINHAIDCIVEDIPFMVSAENARDVVKIIKSAYSFDEEEKGIRILL
jgi:predicted dehydrogenase